MCGFLMMRVVGLVRDRLGRGETADDQNAEHQQCGDDSGGKKTVHTTSAERELRGECYWSAEQRVKIVPMQNPLSS